MECKYQSQKLRGILRLPVAQNTCLQSPLLREENKWVIVIGSFDYFFIISHNNIVACKNTEELANIFVAFKKYFKKYVNCFFF